MSESWRRPAPPSAEPRATVLKGRKEQLLRHHASMPNINTGEGRGTSERFGPVDFTTQPPPPSTIPVTKSASCFECEPSRGPAPVVLGSDSVGSSNGLSARTEEDVRGSSGLHRSSSSGTQQAKASPRFLESETVLVEPHRSSCEDASSEGNVDDDKGETCSVGMTIDYLLGMDPPLLSSEALSVLREVAAVLEYDRRASKSQKPFSRLSLLADKYNTNSDRDRLIRVLAEGASVWPGPESRQRCTALMESFWQEEAARGDASPIAHLLFLVGAVWAENVLEELLPPAAVDNSGVPSGTVQQKVEEASERERDQRIQSCFHVLDGAIEQGHAGAMLFVGCCLRDGRGLPTDLDSGITWIEQAATAGFLPAMHEMGAMLESGVVRGNAEMDVDWGEAAVWYQGAAELGYDPSQLNLAKLLLTASLRASASHEGGKSCVKECNEWERKAKDWLDAAVAHGNIEALHLRDRL